MKLICTIPTDSDRTGREVVDVVNILLASTGVGPLRDPYDSCIRQPTAGFRVMAGIGRIDVYKYDDEDLGGA